MASSKKLNPHEKALASSLDSDQLWFLSLKSAPARKLHDGSWSSEGASSTVTKSIPAYNKEVSDDLYGSSTRDVSQATARSHL